MNDANDSLDREVQTRLRQLLDKALDHLVTLEARLPTLDASQTVRVLAELSRGGDSRPRARTQVRGRVRYRCAICHKLVDVRGKYRHDRMPGHPLHGQPITNRQDRARLGLPPHPPEVVTLVPGDPLRAGKGKPRPAVKR